jgi:nucleoside-diphosphate-sugar epimerase
MIASASNVLIVGGTGSTGQQVVNQLLDLGHQVKIIVRSPEKLSHTVCNHENASVIPGTVLDMSNSDLLLHIQGCDVLISCLGHTMSWRGIFGRPRRLVEESARRLCDAVQATDQDHPIRFILMSSTGCQNHDVAERVPFAQRVVVGVLRMLLPPHADNEAAMSYLRTEIGQKSDGVQWVIVRPDALINEEEITAYDVHASPIRSAIFNSGKTSRVNVARFMAELATDSNTWSRWEGQMPVIYNCESH